MTEPERAALDHIRQVVDSVLGVPSLPGALPPTAADTIPDTLPPETTSATPDVLPPATDSAIPDPLPPDASSAALPVPYVSQLGSGADQSISDSGAAAGAMLVQAYTDQIITSAEFYRQTGQIDGASLTFAQISNTLNAKGLPVELRSSLKLTDLSLILISGRPVIALVDLSILQAAGLTPEKFAGPHFLVVIGLDVEQAIIHDPLRKDASGQAQAIPWLIFYRAWTLAPGYERAVLVPRLQLVRRVRVTANLLNVHSQPDANALLSGTVSLGDLFEITTQKNGWGNIGEDRWINLSYTTDI
jgi:Papain-like cysteine protease AvrRpt2